MEPHDERKAAMRRELATRVAHDAGITEFEALGLIEILGMDTASVMREAAVLRKTNDRLFRR